MKACAWRMAHGACGWRMESAWPHRGRDAAFRRWPCRVCASRPLVLDLTTPGRACVKRETSSFVVDSD
eukprot:scaffold9858_cov124-Isochrysis_galbana.AAC.2